MKHKISVVVPTYQGDALLLRFLKSIGTCSMPPSIIDLVVVENGPKCDAEKICNKFKSSLPIKYVYSKQPGLSNARNLGIANTEADIIIFFDNDMKFNNDSLVAYDTVIQQYGVDCFYGGPVEADYEREPPGWLQSYLPWSAKGHSLGTEIIEITKPLFLGGNHAVSQKAFKEVGAYDDMCATGDLGLIGEETRLQLRLLKAGYKGVYAPNAIVHHWVPENRCDIDWVIQRNFRAGLTHGVELASELKGEDCSLFGIPCYILRQYIENSFSLIKGKALRKPAQNLFSTRYNLAYLKGSIKSAFEHRR